MHCDNSKPLASLTLRLLAACVLTAVCIATPAARGEEPTAGAADRAQLVDRAVEFLATSQADDGSFPPRRGRPSPRW